MKIVAWIILTIVGAIFLSLMLVFVWAPRFLKYRLGFEI